jgi:myo-inositol-1(or 4)-monophosphatase
MVSYIDASQEAVRAAGKALVEKLGKVAVRQKSPADLVTDADLAAQEIIATTLRRAFPTHEVLGEEDGLREASRVSQAEYCWVVDPLDGTTNYAHNVPHFSVSVALLHRGEPLVGSILDPLRDELFSAVRGEGAWLNGSAIHTSNVVSMSEALAAIGLPPMVREDSPDLAAFLRAVPRFQAIRRTGSTALNLAYVAMGRFDATWSFSARVWDMAAGVLLVQESGGAARSPNGGSLDVGSGHFLVSATERLGRDIELLLSVPPLEGGR